MANYSTERSIHYHMHAPLHRVYNKPTVLQTLAVLLSPWTLPAGFTGSLRLYVSPRVPYTSREFLADPWALGAPVGLQSRWVEEHADVLLQHNVGHLVFISWLQLVANSDSTKHEQMVCGNDPCPWNWQEIIHTQKKPDAGVLICWLVEENLKSQFKKTSGEKKVQ